MSEKNMDTSAKSLSSAGGLLFRTLKALTIATIPLMLVPGILLSVAVLGQRYFGWMAFWKGLLCLSVCTLIPAGLSHLALSYQRKNRQGGTAVTALQLLAYAVSPPVCLILSLLFWPSTTQNGIGGILFPWLGVFITLEICWVMTVQRIPQSYTQSFSFSQFGQCAGIYLVPMALMALFADTIPSSYAVEPLALSFGLYTAITGVVINQQNIDIMMERRRHDKASLPGKIRVYNLLLTTGLLALVFLGLLFSNQIGGALIWVLKKCGLLLAYLIILIFWLFSLMQGEEESSGGGGTTSPDLSGLGEGSEGSPWWNLLLVALIAGMIYLLIVNRRRIWAAISGFFHRVLTAIYRFFLNCFHIQELGSEQGYYTEETEELSREKENKTLEGFQNHRQLRRQLRRWRQVTDPVQRVRDGYRLLMMAVKTGSEASGKESALLGIHRPRPISPSDTTGEILQKNLQTSMEDVFRTANPIYDRVRYSEEIPNQEQLTNFSAQVEMGCKNVDFSSKRQR